jgi:hypothetical protein
MWHQGHYQTLYQKERNWGKVWDHVTWNELVLLVPYEQGVGLVDRQERIERQRND